MNISYCFGITVYTLVKMPIVVCSIKFEISINFVNLNTHCYSTRVILSLNLMSNNNIENRRYKVFSGNR